MAPEAGTGKEKEPPSEHLEGGQLCQHLDVSSVKLFSLWPPELKENECVLSHHVCGNLLQQQ